MDLYEKFIIINNKKKKLELKIEESLNKKYKSKHPVMYYTNKLFNIDSMSGIFNLLVLSIILFMCSLKIKYVTSIMQVLIIVFIVMAIFMLCSILSVGFQNIVDKKKSRLRKKERTIFKLDLNKINKELSDLTETEENKYEIAKKIYIKENSKLELTKEEKIFLKSYRLKVYDDYLKDKSVEIINE